MLYKVKIVIFYISTAKQGKLKAFTVIPAQVHKLLAAAATGCT
jgi:hypothetical protein